VPWFWSDQYDLKFQAVGLPSGYDRVVIRGSMTDPSFLACYFKGDELVSVDAVNRPAEFMVAKRLIKQRATVDAELLADDAVPLKTLLRPVEEVR
jgi:3-phenylpropionate/trans-cinnamate dioxygenase ferredoxin reductase component